MTRGDEGDPEGDLGVTTPPLLGARFDSFRGLMELGGQRFGHSGWSGLLLESGSY